MLVRPPLSLERHFFSEVVLRADPNYKSAENPNLHLDLKITKTSKKDDLRHWLVQADITVGSKEEQHVPYTASIKAIGYFAVAVDVPEKEIPALVEITGGSLLYSAAREYLLILTSRGPWPPLALPTVRIVPDESKQGEAIRIQKGTVQKAKKDKKNPSKK